MDFKAKVILLLFLFSMFVISSCQNNIIAGCTMDGRICPDGSGVGRKGLNCEFEKCPELIKCGIDVEGNCPQNYDCYKPGYCYTGDVCLRCEGGKCSIGESYPLTIVCEPEELPPDNIFFEDQIYCKTDNDCIEKMSNCKLPQGIENCRNKYYKVDRDLKCLNIDIGISPQDKCLCNEELNKCQVLKA